MEFHCRIQYGVSRRMCYVRVLYVWRMKCTCIRTRDESTAYVLRSILICGVSVLYQMSRLMGKPTICIGENKDAKLISAFVFASRIVQFLLYLTPKFQTSSLLLKLYRPVCVGPVRKLHCWFSHEAAQMF